MKYKVLSVQQPWAYLSCSGIKDIENRTWKCPQKYIGQRVLIHASAAKMKGIEGDYLNEDQIGYLHCGKTPLIELHMYYGMRNRYSAIIGSVEIVDCRVDHQSIWAEHSKGWPGEPKVIYNWVLANPILFDKPILNVKGKLGFWDYPAEMIVCPNCGKTCVHQGDGISRYVHKCGYCGFWITESEWEIVK